MAAPSYAASGAYLSSDGTTHNVAAPAGVVADSVVVLVAYVDGAADPTITLPAGFAHTSGSPVFADVSGGANDQNHRLVVAWHRASGSEAGPYVLTLGTGRYVEAQAHRVEGVVASGDPFDAGADADGTDQNVTTSPAVDITTAGADRLVLHAATDWGGGTWTAPSGFTVRMQSDLSGYLSGGFGSATLSDKAQAAAGATGSLAATSDVSNKMQAWAGALIPAGGGGGGSDPARPAVTVVNAAALDRAQASRRPGPVIFGRTPAGEVVAPAGQVRVANAAAVAQADWARRVVVMSPFLFETRIEVPDPLPPTSGVFAGSFRGMAGTLAGFIGMTGVVAGSLPALAGSMGTQNPPIGETQEPGTGGEFPAMVTASASGNRVAPGTRLLVINDSDDPITLTIATPLEVQSLGLAEGTVVIPDGVFPVNARLVDVPYGLYAQPGDGLCHLTWSAFLGVSFAVLGRHAI